MLYCVSVTLFVPNMHSEVLLELLDHDLSFNENRLNVCQTQKCAFIFIFLLRFVPGEISS